MSVLKYLEKCESGSCSINLSTRSKGRDLLNLDFLLPKFRSSVDDAFIVHNEDGEEVPPTATRFCPKYGHEHILAVANEDGGVALLNTRVAAQKSLLTKWPAHSNAIFDASWMEMNLLTASGDKTIQLWDTTVQKQISVMKGHTSSVKTIDVQPYSSNVFATGSRDGNIMVWDIRRHTSGNHQLPVIVIHNAHDAHSVFGATSRHRRRIVVPEKICVVSPLNTVSCILHQNEHLLISAGASDSEIKLWDLRTMGKKSTLKSRGSLKPKGYSSIAMHPSRISFFVNGVDGIIYQYSCSNYELVSTYYGHKVNTYFVKMAISGDGRYILSGSSDDKAYIWKRDEPGPPLVSLTGHLDEVTSVAWCATDFTKVITCSDDGQVLRWNLYPEKPSHSTVFIGEAEEIDRGGTLPPPSHLTLSTSDKEKVPKTPRSGSSTFSPVLTTWLTPQRNSEVSPPINVTPIKRTFTLPKKRQLSDEERENSPGGSKRAPQSPNGKNILTQRQCNNVARKLNNSFTEESTKQNPKSKKTQSKTVQKPKSRRTLKKKQQPPLNSITNYFHNISKT